MSESPRSVARVRKSKGKGLRTRTGCTTCRERHVKCDETRPVCRACQRGNRPCQYTTAQPSLGSSDSSTVKSIRSIGVLYSSNNFTQIVYVPSTSNGLDQSTTIPAETSTTQTAALGARHQHSRSVDDTYTAGVDETSMTYSDNRDVNQRIQSISANDNFGFPTLEPTALNTTSPASTASGHLYSAEVAPLRWLNLLRRDASAFDTYPQGQGYADVDHSDSADQNQTTGHPSFTPVNVPGARLRPDESYNIEGFLDLSDPESKLLRHFVEKISTWIDLTDRDASFASNVPTMALKNRGLMLALLALSARHQSLLLTTENANRPDRTVAVQYYHETLQYLQTAMEIPEYLKSDELLATVLLISTYEMIDGFESGWERHLKGVFWIQRSQLIHGEYGGLKQAIWWAWLRQDIWAAFRSHRVILSFYTLKKECSELDRWELTNRVVWLLGQCISFGSDSEVEAGKSNVQQRIHRAAFLTARLDEWWFYFAPYRTELPVQWPEGSAFKPIWINPPSCSAAVQIHYFARIMLAVHSPVVSGLKELERLQQTLNDAINYIGGVACTTTNTAATIISTQCLFAAGLNTRDLAKRDQIVQLLRAHQSCTGWPVHDLARDLQVEWAVEASPMTAGT
ncbi:hypothetical protein D6D23_08953 [Aureobasidium pullulans]|nr:hypothetical protein D6D23_08953 [Aureobasidium pullulans]